MTLSYGCPSCRHTFSLDSVEWTTVLYCPFCKSLANCMSLPSDPFSELRLTVTSKDYQAYLNFSRERRISISDMVSSLFARLVNNLHQLEGKTMKLNLDNLTIGQAKELARMFPVASERPSFQEAKKLLEDQPLCHPMLGRRCLVRTYSAGVHIGTVTQVNGMECKLDDALRLWSWKHGGLSLSAVANVGIKGGRLNKTGEVYLTNAIEFIPTTTEAEATYAQFIEE